MEVRGCWAGWIWSFSGLWHRFYLDHVPTGTTPGKHTLRTVSYQGVRSAQRVTRDHSVGDGVLAVNSAVLSVITPVCRPPCILPSITDQLLPQCRFDQLFLKAGLELCRWLSTAPVACVCAQSAAKGRFSPSPEPPESLISGACNPEE